MTARLARIALFTSLVLIGTVLAGALAAEGQNPEPGVAYSLELEGEISPATAQWVDQALDDAADEGAELAIVRLDTPGGLLDSLRDINKDILAAPMPVVVFTYPAGSRAASAGAFITQAGDVAAMAPETNIGSSTPIAVTPGGDAEVLGEKIENDAAAYMRALATSHGRNAEPGERMVTEALNLTAQEALDEEFIDVVATDQEDLLAQLDGFEVQGPKAQTLDTGGLRIEEHDTPLRFELLGVIVDPTVAFLLILIGLVGLAIELFAPGAILPGSLGAVSLILGVFGSSQLPVTAVGIVLLVVAVGLFIAESQLPTGGILGAAGVASLILAGLLLYDGGDGAEVSVPIIVGTGLVLGGGLVVVSRIALRDRNKPPLAGYEHLIGSEGEVRSALSPVGQVYVDGSLWRARAERGDGVRVPAGDRVRVIAMDGLTLTVEPIPSPQPD